MRDFETILVEAGELTYKEIPFEGINTLQHFIPENNIEEMQKIKPTLDKELVELEEEKVKNYQLKDPAKKKVLAVRIIAPEIAKELGLVAGATSAVFVSYTPIKNEVTNKYEFGVYGYKSIIVTEKSKEVKTENLEQEIVKTLKEFVEIKPISVPIQMQEKLFCSAILTDKNSKDVLVYIPVEDILEKKGAKCEEEN